MKLFILALLCGLTLAKPEGFFRQEYQFKKSSSTFQNNELQTQNEDEGFYSKHGDLEGRVVPKVDQHNEHMEYVNPKVDGVGHVVKTFDDRDLTQEAESVFSKLHPTTNSGQSRHYASYGSSYSSNSQPTYGMQSNLNQVFQNVEHDLSSQLQRAITNSQQDSSYSRLTQNEVWALEQELKANLSRSIQNALYERYGNQGHQGSYSHSIGTAGAYSPKANYYNQELEDLKKKLEETLNKQLHAASQTTHTQTNFQSSSSHRNFGAADRRRDSIEVEDLNTGVNPSQPKSYPSYNKIDDFTQAPERISYASAARGNAHIIPNNNYDSSSYQNGYRSSSNNRPNLYAETTTQRIIINPTIGITDVAQNVQNVLSRQLNNALRVFEEKYSSSSYSLTDTRPNFPASLEHFKTELRYNISRLMQEELEKNYGQQEQRGGYFFSKGAGNVANYRLEDYSDLKRQVDDNLVKYLEKNFKQQEERFYLQSRTTQRPYAREGPQNTHALTDDTYQRVQTPYYNPASNTQNTHTSTDDTYQRVQTPYYNPASNSQRTHSSSQTQHSSYANGVDSRPVSSSLSHNNMQLIKEDVYETLKKQVNEAVRTQDHTYNSQHNLQVLTDELKSNVTKKLEEALRDYHKTQGTNSGSYTYSLSSSSTFNPTSADWTAVTQQLQSDLLRQLREQLNKNQMSSMQSGSTSYQPARYSSHSSYGSSSASQFYPNTQLPTGSLSKYNQFNSGQGNSDVLLEDCMQGDQPLENINQDDNTETDNNKLLSSLIINNKKVNGFDSDEIQIM